MEQQLRERLMPDEHLLWCGSPEPFETLDKTNKRPIIVGTIIKAIVAVCVLILYFVSIRQEGVSARPGLIIVVLALAAFAMLNPFLTARRLRQNTIYGLTDKRAMRCGSNDNAVPYERIKSAELRTDEDGHTTLLCGPRALKLKPRQWRAEADAAFINMADEAEADRVMFYALPMDDEVRAIMKKYLPIK